MGEYIIQPGDTLSKIAKMTGTTVEQLQKLNGIKNANLIFAGKTIQIPDIESNEAFDLKGISVQREIPKGEMRLVYAYIPPEQEGAVLQPGPGDMYIPELPGTKKELMYGYICPKDGKDKDINPPKADIDPPADDADPPGGKHKLMYGYICPGDGKDGGGRWKWPWLPGDGGKGEWRWPWLPGDDAGIKPLYAYVPPKDKNPGDDDGIPPLLKRPPEQDPTADVDPPEIRPVYAYVPPKKDDEFDIPPYIKRPEEDVDPPKDKVKDPEITATAKDMELLERLGASKTSNDPNGRAQFVLGDEAGEVTVTGDNKKSPETITIKDDTNGGFNKYTYRLISDNEIADGKTRDGIPLSKDQFKAGQGPYYVLISAEDHTGSNLKHSHTEVYRLEYTERDDGSRSYDLIQEDGMDGSDRSSMDYRRR